MADDAIQYMNNLNASAPDKAEQKARSDEHKYMVEEVLEQWYGPEHAFFKLRADDGNVYILRHLTSTPDGGWELVAFLEFGER
jgi:hypothetical protein